MKKTILVLLAFIAFSNGFSQEVYFSTGRNFTKYHFKSSDGSIDIPLQNGTGTSYEMGYSKPLKKKKLSYLAALSLNEYNALASTSTSYYKWNTEYIGVQGALIYTFLEKNNFQFRARGGLNLSAIIYGKQELNGAIYDLKNQEDFSGLTLIPFTGLQARYKFENYGHLSFAYNLSNIINLSNSTPEKTSFTTKQILFGIHFNINK